MVGGTPLRCISGIWILWLQTVLVFEPFRSEIGSGFGELSHTPLLKIPRSTPTVACAQATPWEGNLILTNRKYPTHGRSLEIPRAAFITKQSIKLNWNIHRVFLQRCLSQPLKFILIIIMVACEKYKYSFWLRTITDYNNLPSEITTLESGAMFKLVGNAHLV